MPWSDLLDQSPCPISAHVQLWRLLKGQSFIQYSCPLLCLSSNKESSLSRKHVRLRLKMRSSERPIFFISMHSQLSSNLGLELVMRMWQRVYQSCPTSTRQRTKHASSVCPIIKARLTIPSYQQNQHQKFYRHKIC